MRSAPFPSAAAVVRGGWSRDGMQQEGAEHQGVEVSVVGLQDDDRRFPGAPRGPAPELFLAVVLAPTRPQARPLFRCGRAAADGAASALQLDRGLRVCLEIQPPSGSGSPQPFIAMVTRLGPSS